MRVEFRITGGARAGQREVFDKSVIAIGRHPMNDLRFDVEKDTDVSSKHAEIRIVGETVTLRDLGSTNGTFVNGRRLAGEHLLATGDTIGFGAEGARAEIRFPVADAVAAPERRSGPYTQRDLRAGIAPVPPSTPPRRDTTARIAEAVEAQTGKMRTMIGALAGLVIVGVGLAYWAGNRGSAEAKQQIVALLQRNDSLAKMFDATVTQLRGKSESVDSALVAARREGDDLRRRLQAAAAGGNSAEVATLSSDLQASADRQRALMGAVKLDWETVDARNASAMAFIVVDLGEEGNVSGTGFNVSPSGLIVTNRHVVRDSKGQPARRVAVKFDGSEGGFKRGHVVKVSETDELAWIKLDADGGGPYPTIQGIARSPVVRVGMPVALIGYPLGTGTAGMGGDINTLKPVSTLTVGTASKVLKDTLQLDVYAAQGSSGSPVFNAQGMVIGVLFGSPTESNGRIIYAVPSSKLAAQMPAEGSRVIR